MAIKRPDEYAWRLFVALNQPSGNEDGSVLWENWALARLVYADPNEIPRWEACRKPASNDRAERFEVLPFQQRLLRAAREKELDQPLPDSPATKPTPPDAVQFDENIAGIGVPAENDEVRMNHSTFTAIVDKGLNSIDGQELAFKSGVPVAFAPKAKEVKAEWRRITDLRKEKQTTYHTAKFFHDGKEEVWGLVALHITTKDLPNWFWATWEHESNQQMESVVPSRDRWGAKLKVGTKENRQTLDVSKLLEERGLEKGDSYPEGKWVGPSTELEALLRSSKLDDEKWKHYVLRGTQTDFVDKNGRPTILANSIIEEGFQQTSSCITCHSKAGIGPRLRRGDEKSFLSVFASTDPPVGDIGDPKINWFFGTETNPPSRKYFQFDFVWSTIRAKRKGPLSKTEIVPVNPAIAHPLVGVWTYRALMNKSTELPDAEMSKVTLGTGKLEIASVDPHGRMVGTLFINESTSKAPWKLAVQGTAVLVDHHWSLEFEAKGIDKENNRDSANFWHYEYEAVSFKSAMKFSDPNAENGRVPVLVGRVSRVQPHLSGEAAKKIREGKMLLKDLDSQNDVYPAGFTGSFQMVKQGSK